MDPTTWNNESGLEWHQVFTEWSSLNGSHFNTVSDVAETLRRLNRRLAALQRSSRMTNAQMNSRLITLCQQMGYHEMSRDLCIQEGAYLFSNDERAWLSFDEVVDRYVDFETWRQQGTGNGAVRVRSNDPATPRSTSLEQNMRSVSLHDRNHSIGSNRQTQTQTRFPAPAPAPAPTPAQWDQAPAYTEDPSFDYYSGDEKRDTTPQTQPQQRPEVQKRALQRSGTQRAFDFIARSSVASSLPEINIVRHDDPLAPPPRYCLHGKSKISVAIESRCAMTPRNSCPKTRTGSDTFSEHPKGARLLSAERARVSRAFLYHEMDRSFW